jgi:hypothetical protein
MGLFRQLFTPRLRNVFFHPGSPSSQLVKGTGPYIGTVGGNGLKVYPLNITLYVAEGDLTPVETTTTVSATNSDGDQVAWTLTESYSWVGLSSTGATGETVVTITIDPGDVGFPVGGGVAAVLAESPLAANGSPQTVYVTVEIVPAVESMLILTEGGSFLLTESGNMVSQE